MTLAEQREKLIKAMEVACLDSPNRNDNHPSKWWRICEQQLAAISAAGFSIVGQEVTEEVLDAGLSAQLKEMLAVTTTEASIAAAGFEAMLAAGDLARKPAPALQETAEPTHPNTSRSGNEDTWELAIEKYAAATYGGDLLAQPIPIVHFWYEKALVQLKQNLSHIDWTS